MDDYIQLKWNAHSTTFLDNLSSLRDQQLYTDVTLSCGNQFYPAHRLVLSTCSNFFARALEVINCRSPVLLLHGIDQFILERLLMFMYDGQVTIAEKNLPCFMKAAHWLGLKGLDLPIANPESAANGRCVQNEMSSGQTESTKYLQLWTQLLSSIVNNGDGTPSYEDLTSTLRHIVGKSRICEEENTIGNMIVSNVTSLSTEVESRYAFENGEVGESCFEPETVIKCEISDFQMDEEEDVGCSEYTFEPGCPGSILDSDDSLETDNNFEGWEELERNLSNSSLTFQNRRKQNMVSDNDTSLEQIVESENGADNQYKRKKFQCQHCKSRFTAREDLVNHLHKHGHNFCYICDKGFVSSKRYILHMKIHEEGSRFCCNGCDFVSHSEGGLALHMQATMHDQISTPVEEGNESKFGGETNEDHSSVSVLTCRICGFRSNHTRGFKRHITCMHSRGRWRKNFKASQNIHLMNEGETSSSLYNCNLCDFSSTHMRGLKRHVTCKHLKPLLDDSEVPPESEEGGGEESLNMTVPKYQYRCSICDFTSVYRRGFKKHMSCIHNVTESDPDLNEGEYESSDEKNSSETVLRSGRKSYECLDCKRIFYSHRHFHKHKVLGCGRYRCKVCDMSFMGSEKKEFLAHLIIHKEFKCSLGPFKTRRRRSLGDHMSRHTDSISSAAHCVLLNV